MNDREIFVLVKDGETECGVIVTLGAFGPRGIVADIGATPHVKMACAVLHGLVKSGVDFAALAALAPDSPRIGDVISQIQDRLSSEDDQENPQPRGPAATQGDKNAE